MRQLSNKKHVLSIAMGLIVLPSVSLSGSALAAELVNLETTQVGIHQVNAAQLNQFGIDLIGVDTARLSLNESRPSCANTGIGRRHI